MRYYTLLYVLYVIAVVPSMLAACSKGQPTPLYELLETSFQFQNLRTDSGLARHRFWIMNLSDKNLVVMRTQPSCPCMTASHCHDVALKGDSLWIDVFFDTAGYEGTFEKSIKVETTLGGFDLYISGTVE